MKKNIFIGYRTEDTAHAAVRLETELKKAFPKSRFFLDIRELPPGEDFKRRLFEEIRAADVVLICIGPRWLTCETEEGERRLDAPGDMVRFEVETALQHDRLVVPVLMDAEMPGKTDLPQSIQAFADRNAQPCSHKSFERDVEELGAWLHRRWHVEPEPDTQTRSVARWGLAAVVVLALLAGGTTVIWQSWQRSEQDTQAKVAAALAKERRERAAKQEAQQRELDAAQKELRAVSDGLNVLHQDAMDSIRNIKIRDTPSSVDKKVRDVIKASALRQLKSLGVSDFATRTGIGLTIKNSYSASRLDDETFIRFGVLAKKLDDLDAVELSGNQNVSDLSPLKGLRLTQLSLTSFSRVTDLSPLKGMPLKTLNLTSSSQVQSLAPLRGMPLTSLNLTNVTGVRDLSPLRGMNVRIIGASQAQLATLN